MNFQVQEGDVLGIHYQAASDDALGTSVVPYESTGQEAPLCCNRELGNLSRVINVPMADEDLYIGYVVRSPTRTMKRIPALLAEFIPIIE